VTASFPLRIVIVDDEEPARERLRRLLRAESGVECIGDASSGLDALDLIDRTSPDVVLLDISMPELDGLGVAAAIRSRDVAVIFCTAHDQHAIRAFELCATDYLLKPATKDRLVRALDRVRRARTPARESAALVAPHLPKKSEKMAVRDGSKFVVFDVANVVAMVAQDHYTTIHVGGREHLTDESLDSLTARLDEAVFTRVHRSAVVNMGAIAELHHEGDRKYVAVLSDPRGTRVPISRERLDGVKRRLGIA
jgi:DNA-binding LytR/AlgR family response regulator